MTERDAGQQRKAQIQEIQASIRGILWGDWDPIGAGVPQDEYDAYIGPVYGMLAKGASVAELADYLYRVETEMMGLQRTNRKGLLPVAEKLKLINVSLGE